MSWDSDVVKASRSIAAGCATVGLFAGGAAYYGRDLKVKMTAVVITVMAVQALITLVFEINRFSAAGEENRMRKYTCDVIQTFLSSMVNAIGVQVLIRVMFNQPTPQISRKN